MKTMILAFIFDVDLVGVDDPGSECVSILQAEASTYDGGLPP